MATVRENIRSVKMGRLTNFVSRLASQLCPIVVAVDTSSTGSTTNRSGTWVGQPTNRKGKQVENVGGCRFVAIIFGVMDFA